MLVVELNLKLSEQISNRIHGIVLRQSMHTAKHSMGANILTQKVKCLHTQANYFVQIYPYMYLDTLTHKHICTNTHMKSYTYTYCVYIHTYTYTSAHTLYPVHIRFYALGCSTHTSVCRHYAARCQNTYTYISPLMTKPSSLLAFSPQEEVV